MKPSRPKRAAVDIEVDVIANKAAVDHGLDQFDVEGSPVPVRRGQTGVGIHFAGVAGIVADAIEAAFTGNLDRTGRVGAGDDNGSAGIKHGFSRLAFQVGIEPGEDPADVHFTVGAGSAHAQRRCIGVANHFGDGERGHVADAVAAIFDCACAGDHAGQILHALHRAEEIGEVVLVLLEAGDMHKIAVREFFCNEFGGIHVAKRSREDGVKALTRQVANHAFCVSAFGHAFQVGSLHWSPSSASRYSRPSLWA